MTDVVTIAIWGVALGLWIGLSIEAITKLYEKRKKEKDHQKEVQKNESN